MNFQKNKLAGFDRLIVFLILLSFCSSLSAQLWKRPGLPDTTKNQVHLSLIHPFSFYQPAFNGGFSHYWKKGLWFRHELGINMPLNLRESIDNRNVYGVRVRSGLRWYKMVGMKKNYLVFREVMLDYHFLTLDVSGDFRMDQGFQRRFDYNVKRHALSLLFFWGSIYKISDQLRLESGLGLGGRAMKQQFSNVPLDGRLETNGRPLTFFAPRHQFLMLPQISAILQLSF